LNSFLQGAVDLGRHPLDFTRTQKEKFQKKEEKRRKPHEA